MGFIKDIPTMHHLGVQARRDWDPAAQMREATARMTQSWEDASRLTSGTPAPAVVTAVSETGTRVNNMAMLELAVTVMPVGDVPFAATGIITGHARLHLARQGAIVEVRYDPSAPSIVTFC
ncbi:hypothetical protein BH23ACT3_BH23ACT3_11690 [soil metagenome]